MLDKLDSYLAEIDRYLAVKRGAREILAEIRSHILEKAADEHGEISEDSLEKAIVAYGRPREVAAKYLEGAEIIAPVFRKHLFRYTWALFAAHCVVMAASIFFGRSVVMFPFFIVPRMPLHLWIFYVPMAFIADFGLVAFILMLVTQRTQDLKLPWPSLPAARRGGTRLDPPRRGMLVALLLLLAAGIFFVVRLQTVFFYWSSGHAPASILEPASSIFFSILFLAMLACVVIALAARFIVNSAWVNLARDVVILLLVWIVWNSPLAPVFRDLPGIDSALLGKAFILVVTAAAAVACIRSIVLVTREMAIAGHEAPRR